MALLYCVLAIWIWRNNKTMNCDNCKHYNWYYDYCDKWKCKVDEREVHSCYEQRGENDK